MLGSKHFPREMIFRTKPSWLREQKALPSQDAIGLPLEEEPMVKVWITKGDGKVRASHIEANGQVRFLYEPFNIGNATLMQPRDPGGPVGETINCRCLMEVVPISQLPPALLPQIENRLTDRQKQFLDGSFRVAQAGSVLPLPPTNPGPMLIEALLKRITAIEARLNSGGVIKDLTAEEAFVHYVMGSQNAITVPIERVTKGIDIVRDDEDKKILNELITIKANGQFPTTIPVQITGMSITVDFDLFGNLEFDISGSIFATKDGWRVIGDVSVQTDPYDFNPGKRPFPAEEIVTIARNVGNAINAKEYDIIFNGTKKMTASGTWKEVP